MRSEPAVPPVPRQAHPGVDSRWRRTVLVFENLLPIIGVAVIFAGVAFLQARWMQIAATLLGLVLVEIGVWNLASAVGVRERRYVGLREEVDHFVELVRVLNRTAAAEDREGVARERAAAVLAQMHESVDRMAVVAAEESRPS